MPWRCDVPVDTVDEATAPLMALILGGLGMYILLRYVFKPPQTALATTHRRTASAS